MYLYRLSLRGLTFQTLMQPSSEMHSLSCITRRRSSLPHCLAICNTFLSLAALHTHNNLSACASLGRVCASPMSFRRSFGSSWQPFISCWTSDKTQLITQAPSGDCKLRPMFVILYFCRSRSLNLSSFVLSWFAIKSLTNISMLLQQNLPLICFSALSRLYLDLQRMADFTWLGPHWDPIQKRLRWALTILSTSCSPHPLALTASPACWALGDMLVHIIDSFHPLVVSINV